MPFVYKPNGTCMFFYDPKSHKEKEENGQKYYRNSSMERDTWEPIPVPIDRLLDHIHLDTNPRTRTTLLKRLGIQPACLSRHRRAGNKKIPPEWIMHMLEYTGYSLAELYAVAGLKPTIKAVTDYI